MADLAYTVNMDVGSGDGSVRMVTWDRLVAASLTGTPFENPEFVDNCVQIVANTAGGATCVIEGSNDGVIYGALFNAQGVALSVTATAAPKQIVERPLWIRPRISGGNGSEDWTVTLLARRPVKGIRDRRD